MTQWRIKEFWERPDENHEVLLPDGWEPVSIAREKGTVGRLRIIAIQPLGPPDDSQALENPELGMEC
jgi:hypothetical protein